MSGAIAIITAIGVVVAILTNLTNILRYLDERKERRRQGGRGGLSGRGGRSGHDARGAPGREPRVGATPLGVAGPLLGALQEPTVQPPANPIRTPDQRLRVFVSSTLNELAEERAHVRQAVEALRLTPVMFELGARPHPPADLYRSYLQQSDVFIAIYGDSYGWVAPGSDVSGIEDEYARSSSLPSLIYVKRDGSRREPRLERLLERVRDDGRVSYRAYGSPLELAELVGNDLAVLVSERFHAGRASDQLGVLQGADAAPWPALSTYDTPSPIAMAGVPRPLTSFVGRQLSLDEVGRLLRRPDVRLVTLYGPGGIGKSRLAVKIAATVGDAFPDGIAYVALEAVKESDLVLSELALVLGLRETTGSGPFERIVSALRSLRVLIVLDNFEGLVDAAPQLTSLLAHLPDLKILVTSRVILRAAGEVAFPVPPLRLPEAGLRLSAADALEYGAVRLFVERAQAVRPDFELTDDNADEVIDVCRRLDGLPLAIELAAARMRSMSIYTLKERITSSLPLLTGGPRDAPERQRTLRDTIALSYEALDDSPRELFIRLAVFGGSVHLAAAEHVIGGQTLIDDLAALCDASMLMPLASDSERFGMLETLREFAVEKLAVLPERAALAQRHAEHFLALALTAFEGLRAAGQERWLELLRLDEANLRYAINHFVEAEQLESALRITTALRPYWQRSGSLEEGRKRLHQVLALAEGVPASLRGPALLGEGILAWRQGDLSGARPLLEESLELARATGDTWSMVSALRTLGVLAQNLAEYRVAESLLLESVALAQQLGDDELVGNSYLSLGNVALDESRHDDAERYYRDSLALAKRQSDTLGVAHALDNLGVAAWHKGDLDEAERLTDEVESLYLELGMHSGLANVWHRRCLIALARGDLEEAERLGLEALEVKRAHGEGRGAAFVLFDLARVALSGRDPERARERIAEGLELAKAHGAPVITVLYVEALAALLLREKRFEEAYSMLVGAELWRRRMAVPVAPVNLAAFQRLGREISAKLDAYSRARIEEQVRELDEDELVTQAERMLRGKGR